MSKTYYTGIGARKTPVDKQEYLFKWANDLAEQGWTLRSGGADGADSAFEAGCDWAKGDKEIYVPWNGFNGNSSRLTPTADAFLIAKEFHPAWEKLSQGAQKLMARNSHQVLGHDLNTPSTVLFYWTEGGKEIGGTAQALRIAKAYDIQCVWVDKENKS